MQITCQRLQFQSLKARQGRRRDAWLLPLRCGLCIWQAVQSVSSLKESMTTHRKRLRLHRRQTVRISVTYCGGRQQEITHAALLVALPQRNQPVFVGEHVMVTENLLDGCTLFATAMSIATTHADT